MTIQEKLNTIAYNQQRVYDAGYEAGIRSVKPKTVTGTGIVTITDVSTVSHDVGIVAPTGTSVQVFGKNMFDATSGNYICSTADTTVEASEGTVKITTTIDRSDTWTAVSFCLGKVKDFLGKTITISGKYTHSTGAYDPSLAVYGTNTLIEGISMGGSFSGPMLSWNDFPTITEDGVYFGPAYINPEVLSTCEYLVLSIYLQSGGPTSAGDWGEWRDIQVEVGDTVTDYVPYTGSTVIAPATVKNITPIMTFLTDADAAMSINYI